MKPTIKFYEVLQYKRLISASVLSYISKLPGVAEADTFSGKAMHLCKIAIHCCSTVLLEYFEF